MGFFDDVNDAMSRDTGLRTVANVGLQAMGDTSWRKPESTVDPADAQVYAAQGKAQQQQGIQTAQDLGDRMQRKYFTGLEGPQRQLPSFDPGQVQGKQVYNTYDPDRPASMGAKGNNPWQDMARQLATFSELRNRGEPTGGFNSLTDQNAIDNAEKTQRWALDDAVRQVPFNQRGQAALHAAESMQGNQTQRRGQDIQAANAVTGAGLQARGQDMQYKSHMEGLNVQGRNQRELAGLQSQNQLENTRLGYTLQGENQGLHDMRSDESARGLAQLRQKMDSNDPLKAAQAKESQARSRMLGTQADQYEREAAYGKTPHAQYMKQIELLGKGAQAGDPVATKMYQDALAKLAFFNQKSGFADGGQVETPEQVMARIQAKYGVSGNTPQPQQQVQAPQPQQQPQPQATGSLMDRLRNVATGGLDRRMQAAGFAEGGPINVGGRSVHGEGDGKSDSLPAVIDGEHPAALSSGEFVMPVEAVRHFGLDRLNKMVAAARKGLDTGRESA